jgi:hypothetical protein
MTAGLRTTIAVHVEEPNDIALARLDDDGGNSQAPRQWATRNDGAYGFSTPMIPGARERGMLTTFGVHAIVIPDSPSTMDATTIAARQREGGGAPNRRGRARDGSPSKSLAQKLRRFLFGS